MRVAFLASEVFPFAKTGGLADVVGVLPLALEKLGIKVSIFMPYYKGIKTTGPLEKISIDVSKTRIGQSVDVYFIENEKFFAREGLYGDRQGDYKDNLDRFSFFCSKALQAMKSLHTPFDIIHCHDWQTALVPAYIKELFKTDKFFQKSKSILTIHNLAFQGSFKKEEFSKTRLPQSLFAPHAFEFFGKVNLLKGGLLYADRVTTVSPQYSKEILTSRFGAGLDGVLRSRRDEVVGILNGIDYNIWNPEKDSYVVQKYSKSDHKSGKFKNKKWLLEEMNFKDTTNMPIFGFVGRLSSQKGVDLILEAIDDLSDLNVKVVIQGIGEERYHGLFSELVHRYPHNIAVRLEFEERTARAIYAGSDFFLMPSTFEPCGLSQLIALKYGTIPIAYKTGGLVDTVKAFDEKTKEGNGFLFDNYTKKDFLSTIKKAIEIYENKFLFDSLVVNALNSDYSWDKSAKEYQELYQCLQSE
jgi:starch synthase